MTARREPGRSPTVLTPGVSAPDSFPVEPDPTPTTRPATQAPTLADAASGGAPSRISLRLDLGLGKRLGPGKIRLLEAIARHGSIARAGREFGMSYRRAWLLVDELNRMFADALVETRGGGQGGGGAVLTGAGERVVALYRTVERKTLETAAAELAELEAALAPVPPELAPPTSDPAASDSTTSVSGRPAAS